MLIGTGRAADLREKAKNGLDHALPVIKAVDRNSADATGVMNAHLRNVTVEITARDANLPDGIPGDMTMTAKSHTTLIDIERPITAVEPKRSGPKPEGGREQNKHPASISMSERYFHLSPSGIDDGCDAILFLLLCDKSVEFFGRPRPRFAFACFASRARDQRAQTRCSSLLINVAFARHRDAATKKYCAARASKCDCLAFAVNARTEVSRIRRIRVLRGRCKIAVTQLP
jgi:hypothetical protein